MRPEAASLPAAAQAEAPASAGWLYQQRRFPLPPLPGPLADAVYARLCGQIQAFNFLPEAGRQGDACHLRLGQGRLHWRLEGSVVLAESSAGCGERREAQSMDFLLPGEWRLRLTAVACQQLLSGAVSLLIESELFPGERRSFRHLIAARTLRWQLNRVIARVWGPEPSEFL